MNTKYNREIKKGVHVDVYDVLQAFNVTNPALQHLVKKALAVGKRGHKDAAEDYQDIIDSAVRAKQLHDGGSVDAVDRILKTQSTIELYKQAVAEQAKVNALASEE